MGMMTHARVGMSRSLSRWTATAALLLAGLLGPAVAMAECDLQGIGAGFASANPGETVQLPFEVVQLGGNACTGASGEIEILYDDTGGAVLSQGTWNTTGPDTVPLAVTLGPQAGGYVDIRVRCTSCDNGATELYYGAVGNISYQIAFVGAAAGGLQSTPETFVDLQVQLTSDAPFMGKKDFVCWVLASNPAGDAYLGEGLFQCGGQKGGPLGPGGVATYVDENGLASLQLYTGSASTSPVQVLAYPMSDPKAMASTVVGTVAVLEAISPGVINTAVGEAFDIELRAEDATGLGFPGALIEFSSNDPAITPPNASDTTDSSGIASAAFVVTAAGEYTNAITATYDPTPGLRGSGDEQTFQFSVVGTDVVQLSKPVSGSGDNQTAAPEEQFSQPLAAQVQRNGSLSASEQVGWQVMSGSATLVGSTSSTGAGGAPATMEVIAGALVGPVQVRAFLLEDPMQEVFYSLTVVDPTSVEKQLRKPPTGSGDRQVGAPGATLQPLVAMAIDDSTAAAGVMVNWTVVSGDAQLSAAQTITDSSGRTEVGITLGNSTGPIEVEAARADWSDATVQFTLTSRDVDALSMVSGAQQQPVAGEEGEPLVVRFTRNGSPVSNVPVQWEVVSGDATVDPQTAPTNGQGLSSVDIVFGEQGGNVLVEARAGTAVPVQFRFFVPGGSGPPPEGVSLAPVTGDNQSGPLGSRADAPLVVQVRDAAGLPVEGVAVGWRVMSGSASVDSAETLTDAEGRAQTSFRFGSAAGPLVIRASVFGDLAFADFDAEGFAAALSIVQGDGQQAPVGQPLAQDFVVAVGASAAKALGDIVVTWTVLEGGGTLEAPTTTTDAEGLARNRLTVGPTPGPQRVRAQISGGAQVEFTATALGGGELVKISGDGQTLPTETLSQPLLVELRDAGGQPIAGAVLDWSGSNAMVAEDSTTTDAQGRSSNRASVLLPGSASVTVVAADLETPAAVFAINGGVVNTQGLGEEQREVAEAIDTLCPALAGMGQLSAQQQDLLDRCLELIDNSGDDPTGVAGALEEMLQDAAMTQMATALLATSAQFDNIKTRIAAIRSGARGMSISGLNVAASGGVVPLSLLQDGEGGEAGADFGRWGFFASGTIGRGEVEAGSGSPQYDYDTSGLTAGVDYRYSDRLIFGAALGYAHQDTDMAGDRGSVETKGWSVSAYSTWYHQNSWYIDGVLTYGSNSYDLQRRIRYALQRADGSMSQIDQLATADSDGTQLSGAFSFGRDFQRGAWNMGPYFRGTWTQMEFDAYSERLLEDQPGSGLGLAVDARELDSMTAVLGGKLSYTASRDWGILMPHVSLEWEHEFEDDGQQMVMRFLHDPTGTPIQITGNRLDSDYYNLGVGLSVLFAGGKSGFIYYEHLLGASGIDQGNLALGLRFEF